MRVLFLIIAFFFVLSCKTQKETTVKMPKWPKEKTGSKRQIRKYTKEFVDRLYDSTKLKDTVEIETISQK